MSPKWDDVGAHLAAVHSCEAEWRSFRLPMATPAGARYPYVYPRDLAAVARAYDRLPHAVQASESVGAALRGAAEFLLVVQSPAGTWGQRYGLDGSDESIYRQEDNTAHAVATLARHVRHERRHGRRSPIEERVMEAIERGIAGAMSTCYRKGINLFYSTTSIHESALERGYTLWTNGAYRDALRLASQAAEEGGHDKASSRYAAQLFALDENIRRHFVQDGGWIRRITPSGRFDRRPDVNLLAPYYFLFEHLDPHGSDRSAERVENELWDPDLGLLQRYLPFREDPTVHLHAGNGPWLAYSAWLAQRHATHGRRARAGELLEHIARFATAEGHLPEHVSTSERFEDFLRHEWETGLDFRKEFDPEILLPRVGFSRILEETVRMKASYDAAASEAQRAGDGVIRFAVPLAWSHAEFAVALTLLQSTPAKDAP